MSQVEYAQAKLPCDRQLTNDQACEYLLFFTEMMYSDLHQDRDQSQNPFADRSNKLSVEASAMFKWLTEDVLGKKDFMARCLQHRSFTQFCRNVIALSSPAEDSDEDEDEDEVPLTPTEQWDLVKMYLQCMLVASGLQMDFDNVHNRLFNSPEKVQFLKEQYLKTGYSWTLLLHFHQFCKGDLPSLDALVEMEDTRDVFSPPRHLRRQVSGLGSSDVFGTLSPASTAAVASYYAQELAYLVHVCIQEHKTSSHIKKRVQDELCKPFPCLQELINILQEVFLTTYISRTVAQYLITLVCARGVEGVPAILEYGACPLHKYQVVQPKDTPVINEIVKRCVQVARCSNSSFAEVDQMVNALVFNPGGTFKGSVAVTKVLKEIDSDTPIPLQQTATSPMEFLPVKLVQLLTAVKSA